MGRLLGILALITLLWVPTIGHATEIKLSGSPTASILPLIVSEGNADLAEAGIEFTVTNDKPDQEIWRFRTEMLTPFAFEFFIAGQRQPFFASSFRSRPQLSHASQGPVITSAPISLEPGESIMIRAQFERAPGSDVFPITLVSEDRNDQIERGNRIAHGIYFGAMLTCVILFMLSANVIVSGASKWFGLYLITLTLLNAHSHGYILSLFGLPPEVFFPVFRGLQVVLMFAYLSFAVSFLNASERYPGYTKAVHTFFIIGLIIAPLEIFSDSERFRFIIDVVSFTFLLLGIRAAHLALRDGHHGGRFFAAGYCLLLVVGGVNYVASIPDFAPWNDVVDKFTLALQGCDALVFGAAIFNQIYGLRRERDTAIKDKLVEYRERLAVTQKLRQSDKNLHRARDLAERHRASLASTSHDLRQPITSLRVALERAKELSPSMATDFSTGLEFLDSVLAQSLTTSRADAEDQPRSAAAEDGEAVELQMVLENVQRMFAAEAEQKGLDLKVVPSSLQVRVKVIDLIRIVSNLTANAIRYTDSGGVLVGVRRRRETVAIEIFDTGRGIPANQIEIVMKPYERGSASESSPGEGLGLSIVKQLTDDNGLTLSVCSVLGKGSVFTISGLRRL